MQKKCLLIGLLDTQGYESDQRVYSRGGVAITVKAGNLRTQVIRKYETDKSSRSNRKHGTSEQG